MIITQEQGWCVYFNSLNVQVFNLKPLLKTHTQVSVSFNTDGAFSSDISSHVYTVVHIQVAKVWQFQLY